jgi:Sec-independent protein secretion pathway component TatC
LLAVPVYLLYELGIVMARIFALRDEPAEQTDKA